jgi:hypothetical protein
LLKGLMKFTWSSGFASLMRSWLNKLKSDFSLMMLTPPSPPRRE